MVVVAFHSHPRLCQHRPGPIPDSVHTRDALRVQASGMRQNLFVYGTLMFPAVMEAVTGRSFASEPAWLDGYARYRLRGATYPGIVPAVGARVVGVLHRGLDARSLAQLDRFEGEPYRRAPVRVSTAGGKSIGACAYVVRPGRAVRVSRRPWDPQQFQHRGLRQFRRSYAGFRARKPRPAPA
jgi:gamma-glutamylcyclotransferase (GGCT)/AIG2-like uncharacterized protein YtfP